MDYATKMAFRAVITCLRKSNRISDEEVEEIVDAIEDAARQARAECRRPEHGMLKELASDLGRDCGMRQPHA
jgi:histidinol phosphatase-like enzyme